MEICRDIANVRRTAAAARAAGRRVGFVPTMGALHTGHVSLMDAARSDGTFVVASIFVNPLQFGPHEDFSRYPRDEEADFAQCRAAGVDAVFVPPVEAMYPPGGATKVTVARLTGTLCGPWRPGHFDGVATVVAKLFNIVQPHAAYFGEKDAQQLAILRRMVVDLDFPIQIVGCPIIREPDGLAMSSRNRYLSAAERAQALSLSRALTLARQRVAEGESNPRLIEEQMREVISSAGKCQIDYISVVDRESLQLLDRILGPVLVAVAVRIGSTRLIDNTVAIPPH